jgi:type IX secretion system PorP/SprF family membrane protein
MAFAKIDAQQNSNYIHYMFNGILFNPAYAGSHEALNLTALYRKQWWGINGSPVTISFGAHSPLKNNKISAGLIVENERLGIINHTRAEAIYAYRIKLQRGKLSFGLQAGVDVIKSDWRLIRTHDENDPNFIMAPQNKTIPVAGAGIYYYTSNFYFGLSAPRFFADRNITYNNLIVNTGALIKMSDNTWLKPAVLVKSSPATIPSVNAMLAAYYKNIIGVGAGLTWKSSWMTFVDIKINDQLNFAYGFESATSRIRTYTSGTHEVMLRYLFRYRINAVNARYF